MTWDGSICLGPGWLLGLRGMLAVGLRIMPACTGRFMAPPVGAQLTLTAGAWLPQSPEAMAGRGALPPIIPVQKPNTLRHQHMIRTALTPLLPEELHFQQYQCCCFTQSTLYHHNCPSRCAKLQNDALHCLLEGLETVIHLTRGRLFYHFRNAARGKCSHMWSATGAEGVWIAWTSFLRKWITFADGCQCFTFQALSENGDLSNNVLTLNTLTN